MKRRVTLRRVAEQDLAEHAEFIAQDNPAAALRFLDSAEETFQRVAAMPEIGRQRRFAAPQLFGIRSWPIRGFERYLIFYRFTDEDIDILRILHGAQDIEHIFEP